MAYWFTIEDHLIAIVCCLIFTVGIAVMMNEWFGRNRMNYDAYPYFKNFMKNYMEEISQARPLPIWHTTIPYPPKRNYERTLSVPYPIKPIAKVIRHIEKDGGIIFVCELTDFGKKVLDCDEDDTIEEAPKVPESAFKGLATLKVRFRSLEQYKEFRYKVLKTGWTTEDNYPTYEQIVMPITCYDDVEKMAKQIFALLQYGYEVYACRFQLEEHLVETEHPTDDDESPFNVGVLAGNNASENFLKHIREVCKEMGLT